MGRLVETLYDPRPIRPRESHHQHYPPSRSTPPPLQRRGRPRHGKARDDRRVLKVRTPDGQRGFRGVGKARVRVSSVALLMVLAWPAAAAERAGEELALRYWLPRTAKDVDAVRRAAVDALPPWCNGLYEAPPLVYPELADDRDADIEATADTATYLIDQELLMEGAVEIRQGNRRVLAERARADTQTRNATLTGGVVLEERTAILAGADGTTNLDTGAATLNDVQLLLPAVRYRGRAKKVAQSEAGDLTLSRARFTRCEPGTGSWSVGARRLDMGADEIFATARDAVLRVGGVPVLYAPYVRFPVSDERQSGFLFPAIGFSNNDGLDVALPYYLNLAPNYDATLTPRYIGERGAALEAEGRHLSRYTATEVFGAFLQEDDRYNGELDRQDFDDQVAAGADLGPFEPEDRWLFQLQHQGSFGRFSTFIDHTALSDRDYFRDLGGDLGITNQVQVERIASLRYDQGPFAARLWTQRFKRLDFGREGYRREPQLDLTYETPVVRPLVFRIGAEAVSFDRSNNRELSGLQRLVGQRFHGEASLSLPLSRAWGFLIASGGYRYTRYDLDDAESVDDATPERGLAFGSLNAGLFFERDLDWFDRQLLQTLEPRLYYLWQEFEDQSQLPLFDATQLSFSFQQLYRDNRFSGRDRYGDANQLSAGLTSRLLNRTTGVEYVRMSVGQIYYFEDRRVSLSGTQTIEETRDSSLIASEASLRLFGNVNGTGTLIWDPREEETVESSLTLGYRADSRRIVNFGFRRFRTTEIEQGEASVYWPLARRWSVIGRWQYDFDTRQTIEAFGGVEYNNCCVRVRLIGRSNIEAINGAVAEGARSDEGIFVQLVFKGLAGFGSGLESMLERGIRGYRYDQTDTL